MDQVTAYKYPAADEPGKKGRPEAASPTRTLSSFLPGRPLSFFQQFTGAYYCVIVSNQQYIYPCGQLLYRYGQG